MALHIQYSNDKKFVQIPVNEWEILIRDYEKLKQRQLLKNDLKSAFVSIKNIEKGVEAEISLEDFLNEN